MLEILEEGQFFRYQSKLVFSKTVECWPAPFLRAYGKGIPELTLERFIENYPAP